jgi:hypothetical protein
MDKKTLVDEDIKAGQQFVRELEVAGLPIASAMWLRRPEDETWQFYLATPDVEKYGPLSVYTFADRLLRQKNIPRLTIDDVAVANTTNHFVNSVSRALNVTNRVVRVINCTFDNVQVSDAVVYKVSRNVRPSKQRPRLMQGARERTRERA